MREPVRAGRPAGQVAEVVLEQGVAVVARVESPLQMQARELQREQQEREQWPQAQDRELPRQRQILHR